MTMSSPGSTITIPRLRRAFKGEFMNAFKTGNGQLLSKPIQVETEGGIWLIAKITSVSYEGPKAIAAEVTVVPPPETNQGMKTARLELDLRESQMNAEFTIKRVY